MNQKSFTLAELATLTNSKLIGDPLYKISNVGDLDTAKSFDISFLANPRYERAMQRSKAGAVFVDPSIPLMANRNFLVNENPSQAFQKTLEIFFGNRQGLSGFTNIHPTAVVHPTCKIAAQVTIGPFSVIDQNVVIEQGSCIGSHCYIGSGTKVGKNCLFHSHVTVREYCEIGDRVILQPGVVIGSCGFGYLTDARGKHSKLNQVGVVIIEDDVEVGANTTIDRARFKETRVGKGTKIDNLVQIGHGVEIGSDCIIVAQTGIAGSTKVGNNVVIGGQAAIAGHIQIDDRVQIAARAGVSKSLQTGKYGGIPAIDFNEYQRNNVYLRNIEKYVEQIKELREKLSRLETHLDVPLS